MAVIVGAVTDCVGTGEGGTEGKNSGIGTDSGEAKHPAMSTEKTAPRDKNLYMDRRLGLIINDSAENLKHRICRLRSGL